MKAVKITYTLEEDFLRRCYEDYINEYKDEPDFEEEYYIPFEKFIDEQWVYDHLDDLPFNPEIEFID